MSSQGERAGHLVGDGYDAEPLLKAPDVGRLLRMPTKSVYALPIPRVVIGPRRIRWLPADVAEFIARRVQED